MLRDVIMVISCATIAFLMTTTVTRWFGRPAKPPAPRCHSCGFKLQRICEMPVSHNMPPDTEWYCSRHSSGPCYYASLPEPKPPCEMEV